MAFSEGNQLQTHFQRDGTRNGFFNIKNTFTESLQLPMPVRQQGMWIFKADCADLLSCQVKLWLGKL